MFEKLLSLLLHAKAGAISGVFLLGATGALVTVSAQNGVTTITLTDPSASPSASASPHPTASASPVASGSPRPSSSPNLSSPKLADTTACSDEAKALALQVQRVDSAFKTFHTDLMKLRNERAKATIETADKQLKTVRQAAVKAIHATATCKKHEDADESDTNDETDNDDQNGQQGDNQGENEDKNDKDKTATTTTGITFTGDAKSIADQAITAMTTAFNTAKNAPATAPKASHSPEPKTTNDKKHDDKGTGHHD